ncbi:MAG: (2Fe-2S)-binding protein [Silvanigrellales bacterium]|nr:(2Fe-2S)-binding protein [Silvanigrellales bacterium]
MNNTLKFRVNGDDVEVAVPPMARLLDVLRETLGLTGTKEGCGEGECGACSVLVDGVLVNSCLVPVAQVQGGEVLTIEGVALHGAGAGAGAAATPPALHPIQSAFLQCGGAQCGICTPGMVMATVAFLQDSQKGTVTEESIREALSGNLCRCTGYVKIVDAVLAASQGAKP